MAHHEMPSEQDIALRKRQLLAESAVYRASLATSIHDVRHSLRADSLARRAAGFVATTAIGMVKGKMDLGGGISMQSLLPLAIKAFSFASKKPFRKKILRTVAIVAAAASAANVFLRKKKPIQRDPEREDAAGEGD
jgi:hypothetical protein